MTFWNPATKLDKICMLLKENFELRNLTFFTRTWPGLGSDMKMSVTIKFYVPNDPYSICHMIFVLYSHAVTSFDLTLTCA